jgi:hypothetical protein
MKTQSISPLNVDASNVMQRVEIELGHVKIIIGGFG